MRKTKHILDWYIDNTPSDEKEYDKGCLAIAIIFIAFGTVFCLL